MADRNPFRCSFPASPAVTCRHCIPRYSTKYLDTDVARQGGDGEALSFAPVNAGVEKAGAPWALTKQTGLYYYGLRYYDPAIGRFINRDPIEDEGRQPGDGQRCDRWPARDLGTGCPQGGEQSNAGGLNLYAAFYNDPINRIDVLGMYVPGEDLDGYDPGPAGGYRDDDVIYEHELDPFEVNESQREWFEEQWDGITLNRFIGLANDAVGSREAGFGSSGPAYLTGQGSGPGNSQEPQKENEEWDEEKCKSLASQIASLGQDIEAAQIAAHEKASGYIDDAVMWGGFQDVSTIASVILAAKGALQAIVNKADDIIPIAIGKADDFVPTQVFVGGKSVPVGVRAEAISEAEGMISYVATGVAAQRVIDNTAEDYLYGIIGDAWEASRWALDPFGKLGERAVDRSIESMNTNLENINKLATNRFELQSLYDENCK